MPLHAEDVYEDLDEADDEDIEDALGEDDFSERRRRRGKARGRGYNKPRIEKSFVTQAQLQAATERIGKDIRTIDASVKSLETQARRGQGNMNQSMQMMMLLPLLTKKTLKKSELKEETKVVVDDGDTFSLMLPMIMMMSMQGATGTTGGQNQGGMDPMMMMMMIMVMNEGSKNK
jgi:hypothetical protein